MEVDRGGLPDFELNVRLRGFPEARQLRRHGVDTGLQERNRVGAVSGRESGSGFGGPYVDGGHGHARNRQSAGIGHASRDGRAELLRVRAGRHEGQHNDDQQPSTRRRDGHRILQAQLNR